MVTAEHLRQYEEEGYFVLPSVLTAEELELLRGGAAHSIAKVDAEMDARGTDRWNINARGKRYFSTKVAEDLPALKDFLFGDLMADICRSVLGEKAYLFFEQYVIKCADRDTTFAWHQDSGYVHEDAEPYLTCWIALDDVTEENGSVYLLPYSRTGVRSYVKHLPDPVTNDKVGYFGTDPGVPVLVPAGSIACFSSVLFHRSGPNTTDTMRRVYLAQYSREVILDRLGEQPWGEFEPFLSGGRRVPRPVG